MLLSVSGGKPNQIFLNSWIKTYSSLTLSIPALRWRLDDELAKCEHVTGTALFMDDQPLLKSLGQWCVSTSSWDESPWCLLTGLIPLVSEANQECALAPNTCFRVDSIWPKMRAKEGSLKNNQQRRCRRKTTWKHASMVVGCHWSRTVHQPRMSKGTLLICFVLFRQNKVQWKCYPNSDAYSNNIHDMCSKS